MNTSLLLVTLLFVVSCGVKGKPQPPDKTPYIGRGEPTFSTSTSEESSER